MTTTRKPIFAILVLQAALLTGCVSTSSMTQGEDAEAARANTRLAAAYLERGDVDTAMEKVNRALDLDDESAEANLVKGMILARAEEFDEADDYYSRAARFGKENVAVLGNVAAYLCNRKDYRDGEKMFLAVAQMPTNPRPAVALTNAGVCVKRIPDLASAERHLRRALEQEKNYSPALWHLADLSFAKGEMLDARAFLQRFEGVQRLGPDGLLLGVRIERALRDRAAENRYADILLRDFPTSEEAKLLTTNAAGGAND